MRENYFKEVEYLEENYQQLNDQNRSILTELAAKDDQIMQLELQIDTLRKAPKEKPMPEIIPASLGDQIKEIQKEAIANTADKKLLQDIQSQLGMLLTK